MVTWSTLLTGDVYGCLGGSSKHRVGEETLALGFKICKIRVGFNASLGSTDRDDLFTNEACEWKAVMLEVLM